VRSANKRSIPGIARFGVTLLLILGGFGGALLYPPESAASGRDRPAAVALGAHQAVKRRAAEADLPGELLSGHSLRSGYATSAARAGIEEREIANVTRHRAAPIHPRGGRVRRRRRAAVAAVCSVARGCVAWT
jgi:hypothetical protein